MVPKGKDRSRGHVRSRCPDGVNRVIHTPVTSDLPLEQTVSVGAGMSRKCQRPTFVDYDTAVIASRATTNAGGMTIIPSFRNCHTVTARLGPRSTPINVALVTCRGTSALWLTVAATKPVGRLFNRFEARATRMPAPKEAS